MISILFSRPETRFRLFSFDLLLAAIFVSSWFVFRSTFFVDHGQLLTYGILFDLFISAPAIYWLFWRTTQVSSASFLPILVSALVVSIVLVPETHRFTALPIQIVYGFFVLGLSIYFITRFCRSLHAETHDDIKKQISTVVARQIASPKIASMIANELTMFYYLLGFDNQKDNVQSKASFENEVFTYHKKNALVALSAGLCIAIVVEATAVHFLIGLWSEWLAWLATLSSLYFLLFVIAHLRSVNSRPTVMKNSNLVIRNGILMEVEIAKDEIESIEKTGNLPDPKLKAFSTCPPVNHNFVLHLKNEVEIELIYGMRKKAKVVTGYVDDLDKLESLIKEPASDE